MRFFDTKALGLAVSLLVATIAFALVSCDNFSGGSGNPIGNLDEPLEITGVQYQSADSVDANGNPIQPDTIGPGDRIAIQGNNMNSVANVYFLGYEADYNPALASENYLIATIPGDLPFGELTPAALDTLDAIRVTNDAGEATYNEAPVLPGPPSLQSMSNEHAMPGDEVTLYGQALYLIESITFPGGVTLSGDDVNAAVDGSSVTFTLPQSVSTEVNGNVSIATSAGSDDSGPTFLFHDYRNVLVDRLSGSPVAPTVHNTSQFGGPGWVYWAAMTPSDGTYSNSAPDFTTGAEGDFLILQKGDGRSEVGENDNAWWTTYRSINFPITGTFSGYTAQWVPESSTSEPASNFAVKFEMSLVGGEWETGTLKMLMPETSYAARFEPWRNEQGSNTPISFSGWRTFTVPLSAFASNSGSGSAATTVGAVLGSDGVPNSRPSFRFINDTPGALPAGVAFAFDHIRVVRIAEAN